MAVGILQAHKDRNQWAMAAAQDPTMQRRRLRIELRKARNAAKMTQADVAKAMEWSQSKIIRIENGDVNVRTIDLKALLKHYEVNDPERVNELLTLARSARSASSYDQYKDLLKPGFKDFLAYEASASVIRQHDPLFVPGLLQTEEYARGLFAHQGRYDPKRADRLWALRQRRQEAHERSSPPRMFFVLDEAALRRCVGGPSKMSLQLKQIKNFATRNYINIQIVRFACGAHPGLNGNFVLLEFPDDPDLDLVHLESSDQTTIKDDTELIVKYLDRFEYLREVALSQDESIEFLDVLISDMS